MEDAKADLAQIGKLRRKLGLTQKKLAGLSGVSQSLIAKIESGSIDPAYSKVKQIMGALENERKKSEVRKRAQDIMTRRIVSVSPSENLGRVISLMRRENVSQLPVFSGSMCVGSLSDSMLVDWIEKYGDKLTKITVEEAMEESFPSIPPDSDLEAVTGMLRFYRAVLVKEKGKITGIITKADLIKAIRP
jgi:predicted transcriptional regulator